MRRRLAPALVAVGLLAGTAPAVHAQVTTAPRAATRDARVDSTLSILRSWRAGHGIPGMSAAIAVDGKVVWTGGVGLADVAKHIPATSATEYRIGSISKPIAAVAAMQLRDAGKLKLDVPIGSYLPNLPAHLRPITMRELLSHTSGIRHYRGDEFLSDRSYPTVRQALSIFENDSLLFAPGEKYSYSTYGFVLASAVEEVAAGEPYTRYVAEHVTGPFELATLRPEFRDSIIPHLAAFYTREHGTLVVAPEVDVSNKWAGGGYVSTPADLVRFGMALLHGRLLPDSTVKLMWTPVKPRTGKSVYGLGWVIEPDSTGRRTVSHTGGSVGGTSVLLLYPEQDVAVSIIGNVDGVGYVTPAHAIAALFLPPARPATAPRSDRQRRAAPAR